jgi:hypothetical protein
MATAAVTASTPAPSIGDRHPGGRRCAAQDRRAYPLAIRHGSAEVRRHRWITVAAWRLPPRTCAGRSVGSHDCPLRARYQWRCLYVGAAHGMALQRSEFVLGPVRVRVELPLRFMVELILAISYEAGVGGQT